MAASLSTKDSLAHEPDLAALIRRVAAGEETALAELYDRTSSLVHAVARRVLMDQSAAEEITIDVYTQVWRQAANYDESRGSVVSWLSTLARSRAIDRLRSTATHRQRSEALNEVIELVDPNHSPEELSSLSERRRIVQRAMSEITEEQREAIEVAFFQGLTHSEVANKLGQPLGTIKTRIRTGMLRLRELLAPLEEGTG